MSAPMHPLDVAAAGLTRRRQINRAMAIAASLAALLAVAVLALVIVSVAVRGAGAMNLNLLTKDPATFGQTGGGIANAIVGSALLVALATAMAVPAGVLVALYTSEFARPRVESLVRLVLDVLNGVPTIIVGIFVFAVLVVGGAQSGIAGSVALAIIMLPLVARSAHEVLTLVPSSIREASLALGISRWRTLLRVVLPSAAGGIVTGALLAVARVAGETAPLLFTSSIASNLVTTDVRQALPSIPITIFTYSESPSPSDHQQAWAAALLLMLFVLIVSVATRAVAGRTRRRLASAR